MADSPDRNSNIAAVRAKLEATLVALGFTAPCITVSLHDTDLDPLVDRAKFPVYVVGIGAAAPADHVNEALKQIENE